MLREQLLLQLTHLVVSLEHSHPLRIAINGIDAAGKTTLANELALQIEAQGRPVIRASIDGFQRPRRERYQRGTDSPEGYYEDAFDYDSLKKDLLAPLGPLGSRKYRHAVFDVSTDTPLTIYVSFDMTPQWCYNSVMKEKIVRITIRFPALVANDLHALAEEEDRSVNWEVVEAAKQLIAIKKAGKHATGRTASHQED